jgi:hypothetical protein
MGPVIINRNRNGFSILAEGQMLENLSKEAVEDYFVEELRKHFWDMCKPITVTEEEYACLAGKIVCCDCGAKVTKYNKAWKEANQRCEDCKN